MAVITWVVASVAAGAASSLVPSSSVVPSFSAPPFREFVLPHLRGRSRRGSWRRRRKRRRGRDRDARGTLPRSSSSTPNSPDKVTRNHLVETQLETGATRIYKEGSFGVFNDLYAIQNPFGIQKPSFLLFQASHRAARTYLKDGLNFCIFHSIWVKFFEGGNIGQRTT